MTQTDDETGVDPTEALRIALILLALGFNIWIMWGHVKDQPEWVIMRGRVHNWWRRVVAVPREQAAKLRRMEAETVFEAIQVVDDARG